MSFMKWFGLEEDAGAPVDSLSEIERALTGLDPREARHVACFAYILHRVARADHEISDEESALIEQLVATRGGLPPDRAALVVRIARTENLRHGGTEDFIVTREFRIRPRASRSSRSSIACLRSRRSTGRFARSRTTRSGAWRAS